MLSALCPTLRTCCLAWPWRAGLLDGASRSCLVKWNPCAQSPGLWVGLCPPKSTVRVLTPGTQNVTICGDKVPTEVTKGKMRSLGGLKSNMTVDRGEAWPRRHTRRKAVEVHVQAQSEPWDRPFPQSQKELTL